jgi:ABC-type bacteriocin/lantibiotic exporter with double-glycine peptidase domain
MPDKPPLFDQETDYSCVPACLRMVLASMGILKTEQELRDLCDCTTLEGTTALKAINAARTLDFTRSRKHNLTFDDLKAEFERGLNPIAFIEVRLSPELPSQKHAVVITAISIANIYVIDPARGEIAYSLDEFLREWNATRRLTILVEK